MNHFWGICRKKALTKAQAKELLDQKLLHIFGVTAQNASYEHFYRAIALILKDILANQRADFNVRADKQNVKRVYYLSMEFLMGIL